MTQEEKTPYVDALKAAGLSGLSLHMLTYLSRIEVLLPSGGPPQRGRRRRYTFNDVLFLKLIADLLAKGIEVKRLGQALRRAKAEADLWIDIKKAPRHFLVTDGTEVFLKRKGRLESKTIDRQFAFAFVLDVTERHRLLAHDWPSKKAAHIVKRKTR